MNLDGGCGPGHPSGWHRPAAAELLQGSGWSRAWFPVCQSRPNKHRAAQGLPPKTCRRRRTTLTPLAATKPP